MTGQVSLVGAGCGPADWITVAGQKALQSCDVLLYDELIDPSLLDQAPKNAQRIPVGKRAGGLSHKQEEINALLVDLARQGNQVVRLKGGDPYLFGRGGEEAQALAADGIGYQVIPGISSALAIPLEAGIPVTHRGVSRSVHIITAHTAADTLPENLAQLAKLDGTLVFLMGQGRLGELSQALIALGKDPATPAAVLSGGNSPHPARVVGKLADIAARTEAAQVQPPAVIVVGPAAALDLRSTQGAEVGLTGTSEFQEKLADLVRSRGLIPRALQRAVCTPVPEAIPWGDLDGAWVVFTSQRGIDFFFRRLVEEGVDLRRLVCCRFAVIGQATKTALAGHGIQADLCPAEFTGQALAQVLAQAVSPEERVYVFDSVQGSNVIPETLIPRGISCRRISLYDTAYETLPHAPSPSCVLFGSAGAVRALARDGWKPGEGITGVCIGPVSAAAYEACFGCPPVVAETISAEALAEAAQTVTLRL